MITTSVKRTVTTYIQISVGRPPQVVIIFKGDDATWRNNPSRRHALAMCESSAKTKYIWHLRTSIGRCTFAAGRPGGESFGQAYSGSRGIENYLPCVLDAMFLEGGSRSF